MYPKLRFKEFDDAWEQRKCGDVMKESRIPGHSGDVAKKITVKLWGKGVFKKDDIGSSNTQYFVRKEGQFIYSKLDFLNSAFGVIPKELDSYETTADLPAFDCVCVNPYFMFYRAIQPNFYYENGIIADGSRKAKRIHADVFLNMPLKQPSIEEQNKITKFLLQLENLITLHQRQCEVLKKQKQFFLKNMFPKEGESVPKIRFNGFTEPWEQRKLGDSIEDYIEKTTIEDQYPVLTSSQQRGIILQDEYFSGERVSQSGNIGYFVLPCGYFTYRSRSDNNVFVFNRNDSVDIGIISYFYPVFKPKDVDSNFLLRRLNVGLAKQLSINSEGTGQHVLSLKKFKNIVSLFPASSEEQQKIGGFFEYLDKIITLHQRQYEQLVSLKKYLLSKMFI